MYVYLCYTTDMLTWTGESSRGFNPTQRTTGNYGVLRAGGTVFSREEHRN